LSLFGLLYLVVSLNAPPGFKAGLFGLAACYLVAFLALGAEWFWARWFASGIGWSGFIGGVLSLVIHPPPEILRIMLIYAGLHGLVVASLLGEKVAALYDMQEGWRARYGMDQFGVARLGKTVTRTAAALPSLIAWALFPKEGDGSMLLAM